MLSEEEFIDKVFDECEDELLSTDVEGILTYIEEQFKNKMMDTQTAADVTCKILSNLLTPETLNAYASKLGTSIYLVLASPRYLDIPEVVINHELLNSNKFEYINQAVRTWKKERFMYNKFLVKVADGEFAKVVEVLNHGFMARELKLYPDEVSKFLLRYTEVTTLEVNENVESVGIGKCDNLLFTPEVDSLDNFKFASYPPNTLQQVVLPQVNNIKLPRSLCQVDNNDLIIYKSVGQPIQIYSAYRDWLKEHVKSV